MGKPGDTLQPCEVSQQWALGENTEMGVNKTWTRAVLVHVSYPIRAVIIITWSLNTAIVDH